MCNEADKGLGMTVLKTDDMKGALNRMVRELGGKLIGMNGEECLGEIRKEIKAFESGLTDEQKNMMERLCLPQEKKLHNCKVPYLKLNLKLQKYKVDELHNLRKLNMEAKYRPI